MSATNINPFVELFTTPETASLGPDPRLVVLGRDELIAKIDAIAIASALSAARNELVRALLLLWHDHLDESHQLSQGIGSADGSFLHAMMHRREPDYWNSKYWWQRVGGHRAFPIISKRGAEFLNRNKAGAIAEALLPGGVWSAPAFVDACELAARGKDDAHVRMLREIQRIEFESLLEVFVDG